MWGLADHLTKEEEEEDKEEEDKEEEKKVVVKNARVENKARRRDALFSLEEDKRALCLYLY